MLNELVSAGLTEQEIAEQVGTSQATINRLRNRVHKKTDFDIGNAIARLHSERCVPKQVA